MWDQITVGKFQQLYDIIQGMNFDTELERQIHLLSCLEDKPVEHYESMRINDLKEAVARTAFLHTGEIPRVKPKRYLHACGKVFRPVYDFRLLSAGQFIDALSMAKTPEEHILNLNRMLAAICLPTKRSLRGRVTRKYGDVPFDDVAECMLQVPILEAQAVALFFYRAWENFLKSMPGFLEEKMKTMTETDRTKWQEVLRLVGAGSSTPAA